MNPPLQALFLATVNDPGRPIEARRCGLFQDLFATSDGRIFRLEQLTIHKHNGSPVIRYDRANIMAVHAVADAWMPDWEMEGTQVVPLNGTRLDLRLENLTVSGDPRRGRPRSNKVWKRLRARQLFALCHDIEAVAEELGMTKKEVQLAVRQPDGSIQTP